MADLPITHPEVQRRFEQGYHTLRRSDRFWAGLSPDLIIEQVLMRSIKTNGGLTRGRGINELQRAIWLLSTPALAEVNRATQEFTTVTFVTSDQHKYASDTRIERDHQNSLKVSHYLSEHFPFELGDDLISIENGEVADNYSVNVYKAEMIGERMTEIVNKSVFEYSFKRKDAVLTMTTKSTVNIENQKNNVDPQLFFQR